jgi:hypothetical protein
MPHFTVQVPVTLPKADQPHGTARPSLVSIFDLLRQNDLFPENQLGQDVRNVRLACHIAAPFCAIIVSTRDGTAALEAPFSSLSEPVVGSTSRVLARAQGSIGNGGFVADIVYKPTITIQKPPTGSDKPTQDVRISLLWDQTVAQLAHTCEYFWGRIMISFDYGSNAKETINVKSAAGMYAKKSPAKKSGKKTGERPVVRLTKRTLEASALRNKKLGSSRQTGGKFTSL